MDDDGRPGRVLQGRTPNSHIIHCGDGLYFHVRERRGNNVRLQCRHYHSRVWRCPGTASLNLLTGLVKHKQHMHTHPPDPLFQQELQMRRDMVQQASNERYGNSVTSIIMEHKLRCLNPELASRFTRVRMYSALHLARASNYPNIPNTLLHLGVLLGVPNTRRICQTVDGADFIFQGVVGCQQRRTVSLIFISGRMIHFLNTLENAHGDGTFKKRSRRPKMAQIFNLTTQFGTNVVGVLRVLMQSRTQEAYLEVMSYIKILAPNFDPRRIHCDFERGEMNAFSIAFPMARVVGCLWHYGVAFSSHARDLGLARLAAEDDKVLMYIRCLACVPLLPQHLLWSGVCQIWGEIEEDHLDDEFLPLLQYWEREWKGRRNELSVFGMPERTNNCSESDNRGMGSYVPQNGPNIYHLLGAFVQMEYAAHCDVLRIEAGLPVTSFRRYRACLNDARVRRLSALLIAWHITPAQFLHGVSFCNIAAVNQGLHLTGDEEADE